jgi:hypothetical protein
MRLRRKIAIGAMASVLALSGLGTWAAAQLDWPRIRREAAQGACESLRAEGYACQVALGVITVSAPGVESAADLGEECRFNAVLSVTLHGWVMIVRSHETRRELMRCEF